LNFSKLQSAHSLSHQHRIVTESEVPHTNCEQILTLPKISTTCSLLEITVNTAQGDRRGGSRSRFKIRKKQNEKTKRNQNNQKNAQFLNLRLPKQQDHSTEP
jgi:hypothetical protein